MKSRGLLPAALLAICLIFAFSARASDPIQFSPADSYAVAATPFRMASGDFNRDGWPDIVTVDDTSGKYTILMNNGAGGFTASDYTVSGSDLRDVVVVNLPGDANPDLIMSDRNNNVRVLTGVGDGTFTLSSSITLPSYGEGIAAGDFNGDGYPDVAVCMIEASEVGIVLGTSGGSFGPATTYNIGSCDDLAVGRVNTDGYLDIVTANWASNNISVLLGNGDGTFRAPANIAVGNDLTDVALADINHDGYLDAVVSSYTNNAVTIMLGDGVGGFSFSQSLSVISGPQQVRVADFNQDGFLDIATANAGGAPGMALLQATGYNTFLPAAAFHADQAANGLAIADFNRDNGPDVATSHPGDNTVRVMKNSSVMDTDGDGMPDNWENQYPCMNPLVGDSALDFDGDGLKNIDEYLHGTNPCVADTDGDGLPDDWEAQHQACGFDPLLYWSEFVGKIGADVRVTNDLGWSQRPSLSWTGSEFGVGWQYYRGAKYDLYFTRISSDGTSIGAKTQMSSALPDKLSPFLSWTGSEFGLTWLARSQGIYFVRVSPAGVKLGADLHLTSTASSDPSAPLSWTGSEFGVSWQDSRDGDYEIYFARVSAAGAKIGADLRVTAALGESSYPSLSWTGSEFGISWIDYRDGNAEIYFARVSADGGKIGTDLRVTNDPSTSLYPSLSWTGSEFGVSWQDARTGNSKIYFTRISAAGAKIGADILVSNGSGGSYHPSLAWTGSMFGLSWDDNRTDNYEIYFANLSAAGAKIGVDLHVTSAPNDSVNPSLSWTGSGFGVSWYDRRNGNWEIYFARIGTHYTDKDGDGLTEDQEYAAGTNPCLADTDGDGMSDGWELAHGFNPLVNDGELDNQDPDHDGLTNRQESEFGTDPFNWDTDGDRLPDKFEVDNLAHSGFGLDPLNALDGVADYDGDGNSNANEYWNGSDPWSPDPAPGRHENPGCYYWGDADGDGIPAPTDVAKLRMEIAGVGQTYPGILPHGFETLDLDRDGVASPSDMALLIGMVAGAEAISGYASQAAALETVSAPTGSVAVGSTTHVTVSVHSASGEVPYAPGFGVVFSVVSGNAVLLGGDGTADGEAAGNRYDISMEAASGAKANMVVLVTGVGPVTIGAKVPGCGTAPLGRWNDEVLLAPPVVINP